MANRSALLTSHGTQTLLDWVTRKDSAERFETLADQAFGANHLHALSRDGVPMTWVGRAGSALGLSGIARNKAAARVLTHGLGPQGEALRTHIQAAPRKTRSGELVPQERRHTVGWVIAAPKTVSLLLTHDHPAVQGAATQALERASQVALAELEQQLTVRRGAQGRRSEGIRGLVGVKAVHYTSSAGDPHLHVHYILNNSAPAHSDGKWVALDDNILFAAQRVAEAAFQATLRAELSRHLTLSEDAWTLHRVGSMPTWEITGLEPAIARFSHAQQHMKDIARTLSKVLGHTSFPQDALVWALHRQDKQAVAEVLEHTLDEALAQGGEASQALRTTWQRWLGPERAALDAIRPRDQVPEPPPPPDPRPIHRVLDGSAVTQRTARLQHADQAQQAAQAALASFVHDHPDLLPYLPPSSGAGGEPSSGRWPIIPPATLAALDRERAQAQQMDFADRDEASGWWGGIRHVVDRTRHRADHVAHLRRDAHALRALHHTRQLADQYNQLWYAHHLAVEHARTVHQHAAQAARAETSHREALQRLAGALHPTGRFKPIDVVAHYRGLGYALDDARQLAAETLRFWHQAGLIHVPITASLDTIATTLAQGMNPDTPIHQHVMSHVKLDTDEALRRDVALGHTAYTLATTVRHPLAVDLSGLTVDQAQAATTLAHGRGLTAIQGVAGAGKSYLLRPVVHAAQAAGMTVQVLARNAKLATELGHDLGVPSATIAGWTHSPRPPQRPTLLIVDEAGLVNHDDFQAILARVADDARFQLVAVGDRLQAQPIDHLAAWATLLQAAQVAGTFAELPESFRTQAWADEATALRQADVHAVDTAAAAHRIAAAPAGQGAARAAAMVLQLQARGESALAIAHTNQDVAAIATAIQQAHGITVDARLRLRLNQQTGLGDLVRTRKNDREQHIHNGDTWTVVAITPGGFHPTLTLQSVSGTHRVTVSSAWAKDHLELAYAATMDSAQGVTVDRAVVLVEPSLGHSGLYSAATRGRHAPVYIAEVDPYSAIPASVQAEEAVERALSYNDLAVTIQENQQQAHHRFITHFYRDQVPAPGVITLPDDPTSDFDWTDPRYRQTVSREVPLLSHLWASTYAQTHDVTRADRRVAIRAAQLMLDDLHIGALLEPLVYTPDRPAPPDPQYVQHVIAAARAHSGVLAPGHWDPQRFDGATQYPYLTADRPRGRER